MKKTKHGKKKRLKYHPSSRDNFNEAYPAVEDVICCRAQYASTD